MDTKIVPFPLEKSKIDQYTLTIIALAAIQALQKTGRSSQVIWQGQPPKLPYKRNGYELSQVTDEYTLPLEVQRRINILRNHDISIKQILIAHELPPEIPKLPQTPKRTLKVKKAKTPISIPWRALERTVAILAIAVVSIHFLPLILGALVALVKGVLFVLAVIAGMYVAVYDPVVVVVLEDDSWLMVGAWYE